MNKHKHTAQKLCFATLLSCVISFSFSQSNMVKGGQYVAIKYGMAPESKTIKGVPTLFQLEAGKAIREKLIFRYGLLYEQGYIGSMDFFIPSIYSDLMATPYHIDNRLFFNVALGVHTGIEYLYLNKRYSGSDKTEQATVGGRAAVELDYNLSRMMSLKLEFSEYYSHFSKVGKWYYTLTIGAAFNLNRFPHLRKIK